MSLRLFVWQIPKLHITTYHLKIVSAGDIYSLEKWFGIEIVTKSRREESESKWSKMWGEHGIQ